jgi:hypothetical protein
VPWLTEGFLRAYSSEKPAPFELLDDDDAWQHPAVREHFPAGLRAAGWRDDPRLVRLGMWSSAVKYDWLAAHTLAAVSRAGSQVATTSRTAPFCRMPNSRTSSAGMSAPAMATYSMNP